MPSPLRKLVLKISKQLSRKGLYEFLDAEYSGIAPGSKVLAIGAGGDVNELLGRHARRIGFQTISFDIDAKRGPDIQGDVCTYDFAEASFDAIVMSEVLEHVHSPHLAIGNIRKALKPGGKLVLTTPFMLPLHEQPYDYYRYTRYGLAFLLREFTDVQILERNSYFETIDVLFARLPQSKVQGPRWLMYLVVLMVGIRQPITWAMGKLLRTDAMTTGYLTTAKKVANRAGTAAA
jgi:SAM-dependent methyltransferase